jgi:L-fuconolactonase
MQPVGDRGGWPVSEKPAAETIVDPTLPIVDAHFHLWKGSGYDYFAPDYLADVNSGHNVEASVYVECGMAYSSDSRPQFRPVGEMRHVLVQVELARGSRHDFAAGILGAADLHRGAAIRPVIEAHLTAAEGRFRGIRARAAWDADPAAEYGVSRGYPEAQILKEPAFLDGAACLADMGLVLDIWAFHTQLDDIARVAARFPQLNILIDHCGGPLGVGRYAGRRQEVFKDWAAGLRRAAALPNVHIKLSGLAISRLGFQFHEGGQARSSDELVAQWRPYVRACLDAFGPSRCIFASNFSVDRAAAPYAMLINAYKKMLSDLPHEDRLAIFSGNARRVYGLPKRA